MEMILIGFMASGKTTISQLLGQKLALPVHDLDDEIEARSKLRIPQIFRQYGETYFRDLEADTLVATIHRPGILATGGGTLLRVRNRQMLRASGAKIILLQAAADKIYQRLQKRSNRPLATGLSVQAVADLQANRSAAYEGCADITINTGELTVQQTVERIITELGNLCQGLDLFGHRPD